MLRASTGIAQTLLGPTGGITPPTWAGAGAYSGTLVGWTGGAGAEWMFLPNWSTKVEYLHYDLGHTSVTGTDAFGDVITASQKVGGDIVRGVINYKF